MFPLGTVLFPYATLPLHVFEPRYRVLVHDCLASDAPEFGVVLIERGSEVGGGDVRFRTGTVARLVEAAEQRGVSPVLACSPALRPPLHRLMRSAGQPVPVLSYPEIAGFPARIETMGVVTGAYAHSA